MPERPRRRAIPLLAGVLLTCLPGPARAEESTATASGAEPLDPAVRWLRTLPLSIQKLTLENGLRVVMQATPGSHTAAVAVSYEATTEGPRLHPTRPISRPFAPRQRLDWVQSPEERLLADRGGYRAHHPSADAKVSVTVVPEHELELALWFAAREHPRPSSGAVLAIVGDFEADLVVPWVEAYFGTNALSQKPTQSPETPGASRCDTWEIAETGSPDHYALKLAARLLGQSKRLKTELARSDLVTDVVASTEDRQGKDIWKLCIRSAGSTSPAMARTRAEAVVLAHLKRLASVAPSVAELDLAKNQTQRDLVASLASSGERAELLARFERVYGDARRLSTELDHYAAQSPETVRSAVARFLLRPPRASSSVDSPAAGAP